MNGEHRFLNQSQPQTLFGATLLLYINAVFAVLSFNPISWLIGAGLAAAGYGIANEKKWGYGLGVGLAVFRVAFLLLVFQLDVFGFPLILSLMFDVLLVALLVHPMSRDYQRIWFR